MRNVLTFSPIKTGRKSEPFNLGELVDRLVGPTLQDGDVLVVSSKFVAIAEGRVVELASVVPSSRSVALGKRWNMQPELCELVLRESDEIMGGIAGFVLSLKEGLLTPNAGIDKSNIEHGRVVLYPRDPASSATALADAVRFRRGAWVGVVIADSRLMPTRKGTVGVALAAVGVRAIADLRGRPDLFGNVLRVTSQAIADDICSGAEIVMGEADEGTPIVLVRGLDVEPSEVYPMSNFAVNPDQDVYIRSLGFRPK